MDYVLLFISVGLLVLYLVILLWFSKSYTPLANPNNHVTKSNNVTVPKGLGLVPVPTGVRSMIPQPIGLVPETNNHSDETQQQNNKIVAKLQELRRFTQQTRSSKATKEHQLSSAPVTNILNRSSTATKEHQLPSAPVTKPQRLDNLKHFPLGQIGDNPILDNLDLEEYTPTQPFAYETFENVNPLTPRQDTTQGFTGPNGILDPILKKEETEHEPLIDAVASQDFLKGAPVLTEFDTNRDSLQSVKKRNQGSNPRGANQLKWPPPGGNRMPGKPQPQTKPEKSTIIKELEQRYPFVKVNLNVIQGNQEKRCIYELFDQKDPVISQEHIDDIVTQLFLNGIRNTESLRQKYVKVLSQFVNDEQWLEENSDWLNKPCEKNEKYKPTQFPSPNEMPETLKRLRNATKCKERTVSNFSSPTSISKPESKPQPNMKPSNQERYNSNKNQIIQALLKTTIYSNQFYDAIYDLFVHKVPTTEVDNILLEYINQNQVVIPDNNKEVMLRDIYTKLLDYNGITDHKGNPLKLCDQPDALFKTPDWFFLKKREIQAIYNRLLCKNKQPAKNYNANYDDGL